MAARCGNPPCAEHQGAQGDADDGDVNVDDGDVNADDDDHKGKNDNDCDAYIFFISSLILKKANTKGNSFFCIGFPYAKMKHKMATLLKRKKCNKEIKRQKLSVQTSLIKFLCEKLCCISLDVDHNTKLLEK